ncbi:MAG: hypothetical protein LBQ59_03250 [Candidatus Peribacteria bacterium]|jgi:hypothetical protein|nr:hypothetical protein [Candidatus Peribacteria bacterium]
MVFGILIFLENDSQEKSQYSIGKDFNSSPFFKTSFIYSLVSSSLKFISNLIQEALLSLFKFLFQLNSAFNF